MKHELLILNCKTKHWTIYTITEEVIYKAKRGLPIYWFPETQEVEIPPDA